MKMKQLSDDQIRAIAEDLECGFKCYLNKMTGEVKSILDFDQWPDGDVEARDEDMEEIEENFENYIEFEGMESYESFKLMEDFADSVPDAHLKSKLVNALRRNLRYCGITRIYMQGRE